MARPFPETVALMDFANAIRDVLDLDPLPTHGRVERNDRREDDARRFYQPEVAWDDVTGAGWKRRR